MVVVCVRGAFGVVEYKYAGIGQYTALAEYCNDHE